MNVHILPKSKQTKVYNVVINNNNNNNNNSNNNNKTCNNINNNHYNNNNNNSSGLSMKTKNYNTFAVKFCKKTNRW